MRTRINAARDDRDQGFTLIELLVVVIIIGILAAIAIPVFLNQRKKGVDAGIKSDLKNAAITIETWATDNPTAATGADSAVGAPTNTAATGAMTGFKPSPGNTITLAQNAGTPVKTGAYCLFGWNAGASAATSAATQFKYDSYAGGLATATTSTITCVS